MDKAQIREHLRRRLEARREAVRTHSDWLGSLESRITALEEDPLVDHVLALEVDNARFKAATATFWRRLKFLFRGIDAR